MRHTPAQIRQLLADQQASGLSIAKFCRQANLKAPTFYNWKKKYGQPIPTGFCQISTITEPVPRSLLLPSGLRLDLCGITIPELAELILEINRADA